MSEVPSEDVDCGRWPVERPIDRTDWGSGPWDDEPDRIEWYDDATDLHCLMKRSPASGAWCGYVGVPPGHPWHGKGYDEVSVAVHGWLTYGEPYSPVTGLWHVPGPEDVWWLGFDCAHTGDYSPAFAALLHNPFADRDFPEYGERYRDVSYVRGEVTALAWQVRGAQVSGHSPSRPDAA